MKKFKLSLVYLALSACLFSTANISYAKLPYGDFSSIAKSKQARNNADSYFLPLKWRPVFDDLRFEGNNGEGFRDGLDHLNVSGVKLFNYPRFSYVIFKVNGKGAMLKIDSNYKHNAMDTGIGYKTLPELLSGLTRHALKQVKFLPEDVYVNLTGVKGYENLQVDENLIKTLYSALPQIKTYPKRDDKGGEDYRSLVKYINPDENNISDDDLYYHFAIRRLAKENRSLVTSQKDILGYYNTVFKDLANYKLDINSLSKNHPEVVITAWRKTALVVKTNSGMSFAVDLGNQKGASLIEGREYKVFPAELVNVNLSEAQVKALYHFAFNKVAVASTVTDVAVNKTVIDITEYEIPLKRNVEVLKNEINKKVLDDLVLNSKIERDKFVILNAGEDIDGTVSMLVANTKNKNVKNRYAVLSVNSFKIDGSSDAYLIWKLPRANTLDLEDTFNTSIFQDKPRVISKDVLNNLIASGYSSKYLEAAYLTASNAIIKKNNLLIKDELDVLNWGEELFKNYKIDVEVASSIKRLNYNRQPYFDVVIKYQNKFFSYISPDNLNIGKMSIPIKDVLMMDEIENYKPRIF